MPAGMLGGYDQGFPLPKKPGLPALAQLDPSFMGPQMTPRQRKMHESIGRIDAIGKGLETERHIRRPIAGIPFESLPPPEDAEPVTPMGGPQMTPEQRNMHSVQQRYPGLSKVSENRVAGLPGYPGEMPPPQGPKYEDAHPMPPGGYPGIGEYQPGTANEAGNKVDGSPPLLPNVEPEVLDTAKMLDQAPQRGTPEVVTGPDLELDPQVIETARAIGEEGSEPFKQGFAKEPFEHDAITANREAGVDRARGLEGIAKNLDKIGRHIPGVTGKVDTNRLEKADLSHMEKDTADAEDKVSGEEVGLLEQYGIEVPEGMSRAQLAKLFPGIVGIHREGIQAEAQAGRDDESARRFGIQQETGERRHQENREDRGRTADRLEETAHRPPAEDRRQLAQIDTAIESIEKTMQEASDQSTNSWARMGPVAGRAQLFFRKLGLADTETIGTTARLSDAINKFIYASTGKQLNKEEMVRLANQLPQVWDSPEAFQKIGQVFVEQMKATRAGTMGGLKKAKYDVSAWEQPEAGAAAEVPGYQGDPAAKAKYLEALKAWETENAGAK